MKSYCKQLLEVKFSIIIGKNIIFYIFSNKSKYSSKVIEFLANILVKIILYPTQLFLINYQFFHID